MTQDVSLHARQQELDLHEIDLAPAEELGQLVVDSVDLLAFEVILELDDDVDVARRSEVIAEYRPEQGEPFDCTTAANGFELFT